MSNLELYLKKLNKNNRFGLKSITYEFEKEEEEIQQEKKAYLITGIAIIIILLLGYIIQEYYPLLNEK